MVWYLSAKEGKKKQKKIKMILKMMQSGNDDEANNSTLPTPQQNSSCNRLRLVCGAGRTP